MMVIRQPNRMIGEQNRQEKARLDAEAAGKPRPISNIGGGRGGSLMAFTQATGTAGGR